MYIAECSPLVTNCIFWDNGYEIVIDGGGTLTTVSYSDIHGGYSGITNINLDPMFISLTLDDYHLQASSQCIDAGTNTGAPSNDIEGNPRPIDGDGNTVAITDMRAYEYVPPPQPQPPAVPSISFWGGMIAVAVLSLFIIYMVRRRQTVLERDG